MVIAAHTANFLSKIDELIAVMSQDEIKHLSRIAIKREAIRYVVHRGLLRLTLAAIVQKCPLKLEFDVTEYGKPSLKKHFASNLLFNISHTEDIVLYAFTKRGEIGIDIEKQNASLSNIEAAHFMAKAIT